MESTPRDQLDAFDIVLALLHALRGRSVSIIHIQKALYLASRHLDRFRDVLEFARYRMGYWSEDVHDVLEQLLDNGDVKVVNGLIAPTEQGLDRARKAWGLLDETEKSVLSEVVDFVSQLSEDELLLYIYVVYGGYEKSDVLERLLRRRKQLAFSMYNKGAISIDMAAKIAGLTIPEFIEYLRKRGIKPFEAVEEDLERAERL
jgi:predicted HTH domain antitoxin